MRFELVFAAICLLCSSAVVAENCTTTPCLNGGTCSLNGLNEVVCACARMWTGARCASPACVYGGYYEFAGTTVPGGSTSAGASLLVDMVSVGFSATNSIGQQFTFGVWVRVSMALPLPSGVTSYVLSSGRSVDDAQAFIGMGYTAGDKFTFGIGDVGSYAGVSTNSYRNDTGVWHHWTGVLSPHGGSLVPVIYRDGAAITIESVNLIAGWAGYGTLFIGNAQPTIGNAYAFAGAVDDVRAWRRTLTATEIARGVATADWGTYPLLVWVSFSPITVFDASPNDWAVAEIGSPIYNALDTPNGGDCRLSPCLIPTPCGAFGNCTISGGVNAKCTCRAGYTGSVCDVPPFVPGTGAAEESSSDDPLSSGATIGVGIAAIIVFIVVVAAAVAYCRYVWKTPVVAAGTSQPSAGAGLPGIKTLEQLNAVNVSAADDVGVSSVEMHAVGGAAGSASHQPSITSAGTTAATVPNSGAALQRISIEMQPVSPRSAAAAAAVATPAVVPILAPPLMRQPSDVPPIEALPFVRLSSESQAGGNPQQPNMRLMPSGNPAMSRTSSEQTAGGAGSDALPPAGAPPLIRGDSLNAVLVAANRPRTLICPECRTANEPEVGFCASCGHFFK